MWLCHSADNGYFHYCDAFRKGSRSRKASCFSYGVLEVWVENQHPAGSSYSFPANTQSIRPHHDKQNGKFCSGGDIWIHTCYIKYFEHYYIIIG